MRIHTSKASLIRSGLATSILLLASGTSFAQAVNLTAGPATTMLPDGQAVPMWGYSCDTTQPTQTVDNPATCAALSTSAGWSPVRITVPYVGPNTSLTIHLTNALSFSVGQIPTSIVIVGQLGGGLGKTPSTTPSPVHAVQGTTWPAGGGTGPDDTTNTPPPQPARVQSFGTEVAAGAAADLTWGHLRPGTYLIESGTHPSIQGPMGLYGVLVVTTSAVGSTPAQAYNGVSYDADVTALLSEIDPVQNAAVDMAVKTAGFLETNVWSGQKDGCGDPQSAAGNFGSCYPPAVNYSPLYYLVNGVSFDRTNLAGSTQQILPPATAATDTTPASPVASTSGAIVVRFVNAGLRMHVPSIVGLPLTLIAEDGNVLPGVPRIQNEVFLAAGKTYDALVKPAVKDSNYVPATFALYDRQLSLSTHNQRDGGMQTYLAVAGGASTGVGSASASQTTLTGAGDRTFYCVTNSVLSVTDPSKGVLAGVTGANGAALGSVNTLVGGAASLAFNSNGTFTYTQPAQSASCGGQFSFTVNNNPANTYTATITECDAGSHSGCPYSSAPVAHDDGVNDARYASTNAKVLKVSAPGVLENDTDPAGLRLSVDLATVTPDAGLNVVANADGSFVATAATAGMHTFTYKVRNSQNTDSDNTATVTLNFPPPSNLVVTVKDAINGLAVTDYRWVIEEDRTFWVDPLCQINNPGQARPTDSYGNTCPDLPVESIGYNFHTAHMPVVATGCVVPTDPVTGAPLDGGISCEYGQTSGGTPVACDVSNGICRDSAHQKTPLDPSQVYLDPKKHYFLSILPGDGINPTLNGGGGPMPVNKDDPTGPQRPFSVALDCPNLSDFAPGTGVCGHAMGGAQIAPGQKSVTISLQQTPLPTAKISVFVFEDDFPLNGENDAGGGVDIIAPNEPGLGGFEIKLFDQAGGLGDNTGQPTYDQFNMPLSNSLAGTIDPNTGKNACPITSNPDRLVGMIPTCPTYEEGGTILSPLAGQAVIANLYPGLYEIQAYPAADRIARGEEWLQTNTLDGGKPHEAFIKPNEPGYFQEFGPGGFHVSIGFANPKTINDRLTNSAKTGICDSGPNGGGLTCTSTLKGHITATHMSRTPDQRTYSSGTYDAYGFTQCYVALGYPDEATFQLQKCDANGNFTMTGIPSGDMALTVFDQWNDIMLDGLVTQVTVPAATSANPTGVTEVTFPVTQWRTNLYTRTYLDTDGNGVPTRDADGNDLEAGLPLVATNIRYRDGSFGFFNNTDLNGYAGFNEVFPFMNWLVVEADTTRYKPTGTHVVYDAGGPDDGTPGAVKSSVLGKNIAGTNETNSLPADLRVPGAVYCIGADCTDDANNFRANSRYYNGNATTTGPLTGLSSGRIDPPWVTEGWQGLLGQNSFIDFGMKPFAAAGAFGTDNNGVACTAVNTPAGCNPNYGKPSLAENGGISGHVIYASTRPFDDPSLLLQLSWEPGVPNVKINLYQEGTAPDGTTSLTLVDTTTSSSWDDWAQGFRTDGTGTGTPLLAADGTSYVPNMSCPGQDATSPFFATLAGSKMWLDGPGPKKALAHNSQFKCFDGWAQLNQIQPAPYDGKYSFPSVTDRSPTTGRPSATNCKICRTNPDDGLPMLPAGKYVVEVIVPPGFELVKEEDKNILLGDIYIAPVAAQFVGLGNVFIMPDQAAVNAYYNRDNPLNPTTNLGSVTFPRHEGDTGSIETYWPCVGATRIVPDYNSLFPGAGQNAPFAGAARPLCDRKEVTLVDQASALVKFYVFTSTHVAGHFTGVMTNDFASEFDPFSPQFGEKFGPPNLPVGMRDFNGNEVARVYADQWGVYNGLYFSTYGVNPPNPTGYAPQMSIACMNDPGPIADPSGAMTADPTGAQNPDGTPKMVPVMITDPAYNPAYSNFCYEMPFMPGFTAYMDTPVIPTQAFADNYNLPDSEYPDGTPAILRADFQGNVGPWAAAVPPPVASINVTGGGSYSGGTPVPTIGFTGGGTGSGAVATALMGVNNVSVNNGNRYSAGRPTITFAAPTSPLCGTAGVTCTTATGTANMGGNPRRIQSIDITNRGSGYVVLPAITVTCTGTCSSTVAATPATTSLRVVAAAVTNGGSGYTSIPGVTFSPSGASATAVLAPPTAGVPLVLTALGAKVVQNPAFSGPNATTAPFNQKTITRHYDFGPACTGAGGACSVTIGGIPATVTNWTKDSITVMVPNGLPNCSVQQRGQSVAVCGEVVITAANGKQSIDAITVTVGGKAPTIVTTASPSTTTFGEFFPNPLQTALDRAAPGDLIIVQAGTYRENLIMWKPVRLQGVGAGAVTINADAHPAGKMDSWRRRVNCLFGLTLDGTPNPGNSGFDASPTPLYTCPNDMYFKADRIPFEGFVGWDASSNGNLAQVLQEPSLMGAYEGAGVTVVGRGINVNGSRDLWGQANGGGTFPDGSVYLTGSNADCRTPNGNFNPPAGYEYGTANFHCNPSRIDGLSIINSSQGGGGIFLHGWNSNMEIGNNRVYANHGTLSGGITVGNGETPPVYTNDGTICGNGVAAPRPLCPPIPAGTPTNGTIPFAINVNVKVHHNQIVANASIGDALFSGTPSGAGGVTFSAGADNYVLDHNWISGNLATGDGAGVEHMGVNFNGRISNNYVLFNQSTNPTLPTNGGGITIYGAQADRTLANGQECGTTTDVDCPPGIGDGTGPGLVIDANLILGNSAESGTGGGLRIQQVNGSEVAMFPRNPDRWFDVTVTNNIIVNNVAGWDGGGVSLQDALKVVFVNNTVANNDTTASAGVLFKTLGAINASSPPPGCVPTPDPTQPQNPNCLVPNAPHIPQPAGLVTQENTPNLEQSLPAVNAPQNQRLVCPAGFHYGNAGDSQNSRTNGLCRKLSVPAMTNDMFWHNRAFHVEIVDADGNPIDGTGTPNGTGLQSQQNIIALLPQMTQHSTGECVAPTNTGLYWDVGVRDDLNQGGSKTAAQYGVVYNGVGAELTLANSIVSDSNNASGVHGTALISSGNQPVIAPYCNGARVPPEQCAISTNLGAVSPAMCKGYNAPAGQSETTGLPAVFVFNGITPASTVDEGHNWINLTYGPLTLNRLSTAANPVAEEAMVAGRAAGASGGAYSIALGSEAIDNGAALTDVPNASHDFFGAPRPQGTGWDIGAVELTPVSTDLAITKTDGVTTVHRGDAVTYTIVVSNVGSAVGGATVADAIPAALTGVTWTCAASTGSACPASGTGSISASVSLADGGTATFTVHGSVSNSATGSLVNTATVTAPGGVVDTNTGNNSATDTDTIVVPTADLSITNSDGATTVNGGTAVHYTVVVTNPGAAGTGAGQSNTTVTGALVNDAVPAALTSVNWTCVASAGSSCGTASGAGSIANVPVTLLQGGTATFTVNGTVAATATGSIVNTATVTAPATVVDAFAANNSATDTDVSTVAPTLPSLDNFNRTTGLGGNWQQALGAVGINANEATCTGGACVLGPGTAFWNGSGSTFGAKQAAAVLITNNPPTSGAVPTNGASVVLKAGGGAAPANFIRVRYSGGNVLVETTNTLGVTYATAGTLAQTFVTGDTLTALVDSTGMVLVWKTSGALTTFVGNVQLPTTGNNAFVTGTGRVGIQVPTGSRVDNLAGGTVP